MPCPVRPGHGDGMDFYEVRARMAVFSRQFKDAETIYLDNNQVDSVIRMYQNMNKWEEGTQIGTAYLFSRQLP